MGYIYTYVIYKMSKEEIGFLDRDVESNTVMNHLLLERGTKVYYIRMHPDDYSNNEICLTAYEKVDSSEEKVQIEPHIVTTTDVLEWIPTTPPYIPDTPPDSPRSPLSLRL